MCQHSVGIFVALAAMGHISVETESVIKAFGFLTGILNHFFAQSLKRLKFAILGLEIGHDCAALILGCHGILLCFELNELDHIPRELSQFGNF